MSILGLEIRTADWTRVAAHLDACLPEEGCGLLAGDEESVKLVLPIENALHSPVRYAMEPRALVSAMLHIEDLGLNLLGAFHSHPEGPFGVSDSDVREWQYPEAALVVCVLQSGRWEGRAYRIDDSGTREVRLRFNENGLTG